MREFVFTDRALERQAGRFVWLSVDAEKERNAGFLEKYPIEAYPTLLVIDPQSEQIALRWIGGATVPQLARLFDDGERAARATAATGADAALAEADRLTGAGKEAEARAALEDAIAKSPPGWAGRDRAVESLLGMLSGQDSAKKCVETARAELPKDRTPHFANVAMAGLECATSLEGAEKKAAVAEFEAAVRSAVGEPRIDMPADDRAALYSALVEVRKDAGDEAGAKAIAAEWLAFLDAEAARAPSPEARAVFDGFRLAASIESGDPAHAVPILEKSEKDLPRDYNPPARLALAYSEMGRYDDALAAADRALSLVYGPRKIRIFSTKAGILEKKGDKEGAKAVLTAALRYAEGLPKAQVSTRGIEALKARLAKLG
jgi:tetratricopeptide (TPR) repeat protein